jgi:hypothetical protein
MNQINCSLGTLRKIAKTMNCSIPRINDPDQEDVRCYKSYALPLFSRAEDNTIKEVHAVFLREAGADRSKLHVSPLFWEKLAAEINNHGVSNGKVQVKG